MPLTPHKNWLSTALLACFPARPLLVRLQAEQSLPAARFPFVRLNKNSSPAASSTPSKAVSRYPHLSSLTSPRPQAIQNP
jgi:hypothetical protein